MRRYRIFLDLEVVETLRSIGIKDRRRVAEFIESLKDAPDTPGDFEEVGASARKHQIRIIGRWAVTYWVDHPATEVKIERIERADG